MGARDDVGVAQELGQARRLVRREHDPGALRAPAVDRRRERPDRRRRQDRLVPAERVAARRRAVGLALPGQLERARLDAARASSRAARGRPPASPWAARPARSSSARRSSACDHRNSAAAAMSSGLVEEPDGIAEVVERRRGREVAAPRSRRHRRASPFSKRARSAARRSGSRPAARPSRAAQLGRRCRRPGGTRSPAAGPRPSHRPDAALVGRVERAQRLDLVAEPLDADRQRLAGREHVDDAAAAGELAAATDLRHRLVAEVDERVQHAVLRQALARRGGRPAASGSASGASVRWNSAWTLATRTRAGRRSVAQAASAATRAALSSRTSSERS